MVFSSHFVCLFTYNLHLCRCVSYTHTHMILYVHTLNISINFCFIVKVDQWSISLVLGSVLVSCRSGHSCTKQTWSSVCWMPRFSCPPGFPWEFNVPTSLIFMPRCCESNFDPVSSLLLLRYGVSATWAVLTSLRAGQAHGVLFLFWALAVSLWETECPGKVSRAKRPHPCGQMSLFSQHEAFGSPEHL